MNLYERLEYAINKTGKREIWERDGMIKRDLSSPLPTREIRPQSTRDAIKGKKT